MLKEKESSWNRQEREAARALPTSHKVAMSPATPITRLAAPGHLTRSKFILIALISQPNMEKEIGTGQEVKQSRTKIMETEIATCSKVKQNKNKEASVTDFT